MSDTVETEAPAEIAPDNSVRGSIEAAWKEVETREAAPPEPQASETQAPEGETETERADRIRDERGRFARAPEGEEEPASEAEPETPKTETPAAPAKEPPPLWTAADKEAFRKVPAEVQDIWLRREAEREAHFTRQTQQIAAFRRDFEPVAQMFEPHRDIMRQKGFTPASIVKGYVETEGGLMDPQRAPETAARIIKAYQIQPDAVMRALGVSMPSTGGEAPPAPEGQPQGAVIPPELYAYLNTLGQKVQTWEERQQQERAYHQQQAEARVMSEIQRFAQEAGTDGQPLRPYFAMVEDDMAELAQLAQKRGGDTPPLHELYETAVYANPVTRARVLADQAAAQEAQRKAAEAQRITEARAKAAKAQRASSPVTGAPRTGHAGMKNGAASVRDSILAAIETHS